MFKKILKRVGIALASIALLLVCTYGIISFNVAKRIEKQYAFARNDISVPTDSATLERGRHLSVIKGCNDCHGNNLGGKLMINDGAMGIIGASNLTRGRGGLPENYSTSDWLMAMQHGVRRDGKPLLFMPSHETALLTEPDMAAVIAYCSSLPAVDNVLPENDPGPVARIMTFLDKFPLLSVEKIDHTRKLSKMTDTTEGVAMGKYLAISCSGCHRENFKGGGALAPGLPPVPDITSSGQPGAWTIQQFTTTLRTGKTPADHQMKNEHMPWQMTAQYTDKELASLYAFLRSL